MRHNKYKRESQPKVMANERISYNNLRVTMVDGTFKYNDKTRST